MRANILIAGTVFGTSVRDSSPYASSQVVLGDHSHHLPICVFASVEEICRRGEQDIGHMLLITNTDT